MPNKHGTIFNDIVNAFFHKPSTINYPAESCEVPVRTRGKVVYTADTCTGCRLCVRDCPANAIDILVIDRKEKRFVMDYQIENCIFCGQCEESCRFDCITLAGTEWELASANRDDFRILYGRKEDVQKVLNSRTHAGNIDAE
ncbi:MAG: 4Fe-4S binding protein [Anaerolineaceae bacterium]|nr:4Fe-4S binding protein [Anaerolineaceae bacterium]